MLETHSLMYKRSEIGKSIYKIFSNGKGIRMKVDMHCHTKEGSMDGKVSIADYIRSLKAQGFGGMVVTDHNSYKGYQYWHDHLKDTEEFKDFLVFKGIEYDTIDCGHMLVIMPPDVNCKILELRGLPVRLLLRIVHRYGGIVGPAHPFGVRYLSIIKTQLRKGIRKAQLDALMNEFDFVEVFNACESLEDNKRALKLAKHFNKPGVGGSDAHRLDCIGTAFTRLPDDIEDEADLISYMKEVTSLRCGGRLYNGTTKEKIGVVNEVLVQGFFFYNKFLAWFKGFQRHTELKRIGHKYIDVKRSA